MKNLKLILPILSLVLTLSANAKPDSSRAKVCQKACAAKGNTQKAKVVENAKAIVGDFTKCPVSGVVFEVKKNSPKAVYAGKNYWVCCNGCKEIFEKNPQRFALTSTDKI